jgi:hypothetical protein
VAANEHGLDAIAAELGDLPLALHLAHGATAENPGTLGRELGLPRPLAGQAESRFVGRLASPAA